MNPEKYFTELRTHIDNEGAASVHELAALEGWETGDKRAAISALRYHYLQARGGLSASGVAANVNELVRAVEAAKKKGAHGWYSDDGDPPSSYGDERGYWIPLEIWRRIETNLQPSKTGEQVICNNDTEEVSEQ